MTFMGASVQRYHLIEKASTELQGRFVKATQELSVVHVDAEAEIKSLREKLQWVEGANVNMVSRAIEDKARISELTRHLR